MTQEERYKFACRVAGEAANRPLGDRHITLTNGTETFPLEMVRWGLEGPLEGMDRNGSRYLPCAAGCDHNFAPQDATVWHDAEHTEELWEVK